MHLPTLLTTTLALATATATPTANNWRHGGWSNWGHHRWSNNWNKWWPHHNNYNCMTNAEAERVAQNFRSTIANAFNVAMVKQTFAPDFTDYSDGVNELINMGCPSGPATLGQPTFTSRKEFIQGQSAQPTIPFEILNMWHTCDTVIIRWVSQPGPGFVQPEQQVTGIIVIETAPGNKQEPYLIKTVYSEFNSGAWLYDLGVLKPDNCSAAATMDKRDVKLPTML